MKSRVAILALVTVGLATQLMLYSVGSETTPPFAQVRSSYQMSDAVLLDRHGEVLQESRVTAKGRRLDWTPLNKISTAVVSSLIRVEDKRFYSHSGVDGLAFLSAMGKGLRTRHPRGASTITMQLASILSPELRPRTTRRRLSQKLRQMSYAYALERHWTKPQILEAYLNLMHYRGELQGIAAASRALFQKEPHGLNAVDACILSALPKSPGASREQVIRRSYRVSRLNGWDIDEPVFKREVHRALRAPFYIRPAAEWAPHAAQRTLRAQKLARGEAARVVQSTLDASLQRFANDVLLAQLRALSPQNVHDGALIVVDNKSGDVLAYVGNARLQSSSPHVDGIQARRQVGSTLKPFLYAQAIDQRILTANSLLDDRPINLPDTSGLFDPHNYDNQYRGLVPVRVALASSINIPAVRTLQLLGLEPFLQTLHNLGFTALNRPDFYGPALALGSADLSLWEMVNAYRALANHGVWSEIQLIPRGAQAVATRRVFSPGASFIVSDILSDRESRSTTFGLESVLATRFWTAVKTGTSKDMRDNWCLGYSDRYTVGVWIGNFSGESMWNVSGMSGAAPAWVEVMNWLHRQDSSRPPVAPADVVSKPVSPGAYSSARKEWYLQGTDQTVAAVTNEPEVAKITYPAPGTLIAIDPDIPPTQQIVQFEARPNHEHLHWLLNGKALGSTQDSVEWNPKVGSYSLVLADATDRVVDQVDFVVRGVFDSPNVVTDPPRSE